jgi:hypothetical protein
MEYSLKRLITVTSSYIVRNLLPNQKREFIILDLTDSKIDRITNETPRKNIISILGNDFADYVNRFLYTVEEYKEMDGENILTTVDKLKLKVFTYFWGVYNNKLLCGKLDELPNDMYVMPVRNWKRKYGKIVKAIAKPKEKVSLYFIDEYDNEIQYPQAGNNTKTLLIGPKYQLFLSCNPCWDMREYGDKLNEYIKDNPCYLVQLDNGRYENYQIGNIDKEKYISTSFETYDDMFVIGEIDYTEEP